MVQAADVKSNGGGALVMVLVPMGPPSMVLILRGSCKVCSSILSWRAVAWSFWLLLRSQLTLEGDKNFLSARSELVI